MMERSVEGSSFVVVSPRHFPSSAYPGSCSFRRPLLSVFPLPLRRRRVGVGVKNGAGSTRGLFPPIPAFPPPGGKEPKPVKLGKNRELHSPAAYRPAVDSLGTHRVDWWSTRLYLTSSSASGS